MAEVVTAILQGASAGVAFSLCQSVAMWMHARTGQRRLRQAQAAMVAHLERVQSNAAREVFGYSDAWDSVGKKVSDAN